MLHVTLSRVNACETPTSFLLSHNPEEICRYAHKTRIFIHLTFIYPPSWPARKKPAPLQCNPNHGSAAAQRHPWQGASGTPCRKTSVSPYESDPRTPEREAFGQSRLYLFERRHPRALLGQPRPAAAARLHRHGPRKRLCARVPEPLSGLPPHRKTQPGREVQPTDDFRPSR